MGKLPGLVVIANPIALEFGMELIKNHYDATSIMKDWITRF
jgi:hypothetical protein